jgi:ureidoacrylate peracid hydrolase
MSHFVDTFPRNKTAILVVDLQNGFMEPGAPVEAAAARSIVPNVNAITSQARRYGAQNIFIQFTTPPAVLKTWSNWFARFPSDEVRARQQKMLMRGSHYWQLWPGLERGESDLIVEKQRFSAFAPETCPLHEILQSRGIDTLIITGALTNICCESTARDAVQLNYRTVLVSDATAALSQPEHDMALANMSRVFADVMTTDECLNRLDRESGKRASLG